MKVHHTKGVLQCNTDGYHDACDEWYRSRKEYPVQGKEWGKMIRILRMYQKR